MTTFQPDNFHCPESCLCGICKNNYECDEACAEYKLMARRCSDLECGICKIGQSMIAGEDEES